MNEIEDKIKKLRKIVKEVTKLFLEIGTLVSVTKILLDTILR